MAGPSVAPLQVLDQLMDNGLFDTLRKSITAELESNVELKRFTTEAVERSAVLQAPGAERKNRRELFESLRRELQTKVLERASEAAWRAILSKQGVGLQIEEQVERTWWELNGWGEPPERARPAEKKPAAVVPNEPQKQTSTPPTAPVPATEQVAEPQHGSSKKDESRVSMEGTAQPAAPEVGPVKQQAANVLYTPLMPDVKDGERAPVLGTREDGGQAAEGVHMDANVAEPLERRAAGALSPIYSEVPVRALEADPVSSQDREGINDMPGPSPTELQKIEMPMEAPEKEARSQQNTGGDMENESSHLPEPVDLQKSEMLIEAPGKEAQSQRDTVGHIQNKLSQVPEPGSISGDGPAEERSERPQESATRDNEGGEAANDPEQSVKGALASVGAEDGRPQENETVAAKDDTGRASAQEGLPSVDVRLRGPDVMDVDMVEAGPLETAAENGEAAAGPTGSDHALQDGIGQSDGGERSGHPSLSAYVISGGGERSGKEDRELGKGPSVGEGGGKASVLLGEKGPTGMAVSNEGGEDPGKTERAPLIETSASLRAEVAEQKEGSQLAERSPGNC